MPAIDFLFCGDDQSNVGVGYHISHENHFQNEDLLFWLTTCYRDMEVTHN